MKLWQIYNNNKFELNIQAGKCHLPLSRGPCVVGKIILASEEGTGSCATWNCKEDEVPLLKKLFQKLFLLEVSRCSGETGRWKSASNLTHPSALERERGCGQSLMEGESSAFSQETRT